MYLKAHRTRIYFIKTKLKNPNLSIETIMEQEVRSELLNCSVNCKYVLTGKSIIVFTKVKALSYFKLQGNEIRAKKSFALTVKKKPAGFDINRYVIM